MSARTIAVDIVLLPDRAAHAFAVELNDKLRCRRDFPIRFATGEAVPHMTLLMGVIAENDVDRAIDAITGLADRPPIELVSTVLETSESTGSISLRVERAPEIATLQQDVIAATDRFLSSSKATAAMFTGNDPVEESMLRYVDEFRKTHTGRNFQPHVTLGYGELAPLDPPIAFRGERLALFQLGASGTCRRELVIVELSG